MHTRDSVTRDGGAHGFEDVPPGNLPREQMSALCDGEIERDAVRFLLKRMSEDPALAAAWSRYQLIGPTLRRDEQTLVDPGFSERVCAAIAARNLVQTPSVASAVGAGRARAPWLRWTGGAAIAASVAAIALFATRGPVLDGAVAPPRAPILAQEISVPSAELHAPVQTLPAAGGTSGSGLWDPRLQGYLMQHGQVVGQSGQGGFVPYVYVLATPSQVPAVIDDSAQTAALSPDAAENVIR